MKKAAGFNLRKKITILVISLIVITGITALAGTLVSVRVTWLRRALVIFANLCNGGVALAAVKLSGMEVETDVKNKKQYLIGLGIAAALSLSIAFIPAFCGVSLVGQHTEFSWFTIIYSLLFYLLIIGPVEELIFRVYLQDTLTGLFEKRKWIGVILAALIFGSWHIINGSVIQALFAFGIGLVFGFGRYLIKDCKYLGLALGHGVYDFLNVIVTMFVV